MNQRRFRGASWLAGLAVAVSCADARPQRTATPSTSATTASPSPASTPGPTTKAIVFSQDGDLYYYDVATDGLRLLTEDGQQITERSPRFNDESTIVFGTDTAIVEIDVKTRAKREIRKAAGIVHQVALSPNRRSIAYLYDRNDRTGLGLNLRVVGLDPPSERDVRSFKPWQGRGGSDDDDVYLAWSPDGSKLLVVLTPLDTVGRETMFVLDANGADIVPPRFGTTARWAPDSRTIYFRDFGDERAWHALDVQTKSIRDLAMRRATARLHVSPDGTVLFHDRGVDGGAIYVYDVARNRERRLATGRIGAVWLSQDAVAATVVKPCRGDCEGPWVHQHKCSRITLADGKAAPLELRSTVLDVDLWIEDAATPAPAST